MTNNKGYYITSNGEKVIIDSQEFISLSNKNIVELILPSGIEYVSCENNQLRELILPSGVKTVYCDDGAIKDPMIYKDWDTYIEIYFYK